MTLKRATRSRGGYLIFEESGMMMKQGWFLENQIYSFMCVFLGTKCSLMGGFCEEQMFLKRRRGSNPPGGGRSKRRRGGRWGARKKPQKPPRHKSAPFRKGGHFHGGLQFCLILSLFSLRFSKKTLWIHYFV